jgi:cytochrome c
LSIDTQVSRGRTERAHHVPHQALQPKRGWFSVLLWLVGALAFITPAMGQDRAAGEKVFKTNCSICHSVQPGRNIIGPSLFGVVGRHCGQVPGFYYSDANRKSGLTWDVATLDRYLTSPSTVVPGTLMTFPGLKDAKQRADVIAYLGGLR